MADFYLFVIYPTVQQSCVPATALSVCPSVRPSVCQSVRLSICPLVHLPDRERFRRGFPRFLVVLRRFWEVLGICLGYFWQVLGTCLEYHRDFLEMLLLRHLLEYFWAETNQKEDDTHIVKSYTSYLFALFVCASCSYSRSFLLF